MNTLSFTILVEPKSTQAGSRATFQGGKLRWYSDARKKRFAARVKEECGHHAPEKVFEGPLEIHMVFYLERPIAGDKTHKSLPPEVKQSLFHNHDRVRAWSNSSQKSDLDNLRKGLCDALSKCGFFRNDAQFWKDSNEMYFTEVNLPARIEVTIHHQDQ